MPRVQKVRSKLSATPHHIICFTTGWEYKGSSVGVCQGEKYQVSLTNLWLPSFTQRCGLVTGAVPAIDLGRQDFRAGETKIYGNGALVLCITDFMAFLLVSLSVAWNGIAKRSQ